MLFAPQRIRIEKDVVTHVTRRLKGKGNIVVLKGQEVHPEEIIGSAEVSSGFRTINLATLLSVPPQEIKKYLKRDIGQRIYKDELLAYKNSGLFRRQKVITAPTDGILDFLNPQTGEIRMSLLPKKIDLPSGVYGIIETIDTFRGLVIIRTQVQKIHGVFGTGRSRDGVLHFLGKRDQLINALTISIKDADHILVGGSLIYKDAISAAISSAVSGIITGGINAKDYKAMAGGRLIFPKKIENDVGVSIVTTEGFGSVPIGDDIYSLLLEYNDKFILMDGNRAIIYLPSYDSNALKKIRSTKLPILATGGDLSEEKLGQTVEIKVGSQVRVIGTSFMGEQGKILEVDKLATLLPAGIKSFLVTLETKSRKIKVPGSNLEII